MAIVGVSLIVSSGNVIAVGNKPTGATQILGWGLIFVVFGLLTWWRKPRYYRRLARIYLAGHPHAMMLTIRTAKGRRGDLSYDVTLSAPNVRSITVGVDPDCLEGLGFEGASLVRSRKLKLDESIDWPEPVKVYGAGGTGPVVIEVAGSLLWPESDVPRMTRRAQKR